MQQTNQPTPAKFADFFDRPIPAVATELGFVDSSWHNDALARMTSDDGLELWCDADDPEERENPAVRFTLQSNPDDDAETAVLLLQTDSETELRAFVAAHRGAK